MTALAGGVSDVAGGCRTDAIRRWAQEPYGISEVSSYQIGHLTSVSKIDSSSRPLSPALRMYFVDVFWVRMRSDVNRGLPARSIPPRVLATGMPQHVRVRL